MSAQILAQSTDHRTRFLFTRSNQPCLSLSSLIHQSSNTLFFSLGRTNLAHLSLLSSSFSQNSLDGPSNTHPLSPTREANAARRRRRGRQPARLLSRDELENSSFRLSAAAAA